MSFRRLSRLSAVLAFAVAFSVAGAEPPPSRPFAPRSGPRGATLFTTMPATETGIVVQNAYADPKMWGEHYREFSLGAIGTGVTIGDFDGDGRPDIFVVSKVEPNHLFRNLGGFRFEDVTEKAGVAGPTDAWKGGATFVDINNDGRLDLYVCRFGAPNLLYINQGDGTFKEEAHAYGLDVVDASGMAAFADYDRDGRLDVYIQTNVLDAEAHPNGQRDLLFHQGTDGTFTNVTDRAGLFGQTQSHQATWWDFDGDGWPDIYVDNDFKDPDQLYHNNGDGTFTNVLSFVVPHTPHSSMGADLGDVNNDGRLDLLVADMARTSRASDQRGMAKLRAGLMENDAHPEAAPQYMRNALYVNTGTGRMLEGAFLAGLDATDWTWTVRLEDLDNDGRVDAYLTNGMVRELDNADVVRRTSAIESLSGRIRIWKATPPFATHNLAYRNLGDLQFENVSAAWGLDHLGVSFGAALGDLDGDGDLDIVFVNYQGNVTVCRNDSDSGHSVEFELRGQASNRYGVGAIVRLQTASGVQVRQLVLARGYMSASEPMLHFGLGGDTTISKATIEWPSGQVQELANLAADRRYTVTEPSAKAPTALPTPVQHRTQFVESTAAENLALASRERPIDELSAQPLLPIRHNRFGPGVAVADVDGDGEADLVLGGSTGERAQLAMNLGGGQFLPPMSSAFGGATQTADAMVLVFEANGDGKPDLLITKGGVAEDAGSPAYQPRLYLNDGRGGFDKAPAGTLPPWTESTGVAVAADFDHDGRLDLFIGGRVVPGAFPTAPRSVLLANRGGRFVDVTDEIAPALRKVGMVTSALWSDVDGDGWSDLLLTLDWGRVMYFHNDAGKRFDDWTDRAGFGAAGVGWWNSITGGDLNGDGRPDYVVGNVGLNTKYHADPEQPTQLYYGDLDDTGRAHLLEAQYEQGKLYPVRGLAQLQRVLPGLARKFPSFESYATATLDDVVPAERLAKAERWAATELRSGVFLSQPDGRYRFEPLPRLAQIAPVFGVAIGDFDGDGCADVYAVQNSYAPIPETGRFDGGLSLLLKGDGHGHLSPIPVADSGLLVPRDAKALAVADFNQDSWPDFFVTRNNDRALAFRNQPSTGHHSFAVMLRGPVTNPNAVGARVSVDLSDGRQETAEVYAGSGYLSQSTTTQFFGYAEGNAPKSIVVRWPDGRSTTHAWTTGSHKFLITAPTP